MAQNSSPPPPKMCFFIYSSLSWIKITCQNLTTRKNTGQNFRPPKILKSTISDRKYPFAPSSSHLNISVLWGCTSLYSTAVLQQWYRAGLYIFFWFRKKMFYYVALGEQFFPTKSRKLTGERNKKNPLQRSLLWVLSRVWSCDCDSIWTKVVNLIFLWCYFRICPNSQPLMGQFQLWRAVTPVTGLQTRSLQYHHCHIPWKPQVFQKSLPGICLMSASRIRISAQ